MNCNRNIFVSARFTKEVEPNRSLWKEKVEINDPTLLQLLLQRNERITEATLNNKRESVSSSEVTKTFELNPTECNNDLGFSSAFSSQYVDEIEWNGGLYSGLVNSDNIPHGEGIHISGLDPETKEIKEKIEIGKGLFYYGTLEKGYWHNGILTRKISGRTIMSHI